MMQKERNVIISRVISSHMGPMYVETLYTTDPYSSDLWPCDYFLFRKIKIWLRGRHLESAGNKNQIVMNQLKTVSVEDFQLCFQEW